MSMCYSIYLVHHSHSSTSHQAASQVGIVPNCQAASSNDIVLPNCFRSVKIDKVHNISQRWKDGLTAFAIAARLF
jgi:hypothetical protein